MKIVKEVIFYLTKYSIGIHRSLDNPC